MLDFSMDAIRKFERQPKNPERIKFE